MLCFLQLAKLAGNKVVATCGGKDKAALLKNLGVDRVIDYKAEDVKSVSNHYLSKSKVLQLLGIQIFKCCSEFTDLKLITCATCNQISVIYMLLWSTRF